MQKETFALVFGNRGFFPGELIADARREMVKAVEGLGYETLLMDEQLTRFGAVETPEEGKKYAQFLSDNKGKYDGVILCLPNFGDETGAVEALKDCGVPILIQAYPDEIGSMDFSHRRDAFCGKFSIMDVFYQYNLPFTIYEPHTVHPATDVFAKHVRDFAGVCRVYHGMKYLTIGAIGARTTAFKTVRYDELTLQRYGITIETYDLSELFMRIRNIDTSCSQFKEKYNMMKEYTDFSNVPDEKYTIICKTACAIDDMIQEYHLDAIALRCWIELEKELGIAPCVILSELNNRGIVAACELDVANAVAMQALSLASGKSATVLDWNNNYGNEPDKCILFHCGPVPQSLMVEKGTVTDHPMFAKSFGAGCGWGCNEGRIAPSSMTFCSMKTEGGKMLFYIGEGDFTGEPIEEKYFGCAGVAKIPGLQKKLYEVGKNGYRHHVAVSAGSTENIVREAFKTYLGYEILEIL
jgi:L-fucose isomerase-like protein